MNVYPFIFAKPHIQRLSLPNLWLAGCLTLTALACAALAAIPGGKPSKALQATAVTATGEATIAPVDERIELAQVGTAVWSHNPSGEEDLSLGDQVDQATWKHLVLRAPKADGSHCEINLLRPDWWVELEAAETGGEVYVSVPECGIDGDAQVLAIRACPPIQPTPPGYRTITGTFHHHNARILDLHVSGLPEPIGVTPNHPFWSEDRQEFVRADELKAGERLLGFQTRAAPVIAVIQGDISDVYNIEVHNRHSYCVSSDGIIVHNGNACSKSGPLHLNHNDAVSHFGIYEIRIKGNLFKVGKADLARVTKSSGISTRIHQQMRKLEKLYGTGNVTSEIVDDLGEVAPRVAKEAEASRIRSHLEKSGVLPPGNFWSFPQ